jgi:Zn-finger protein
MHKGVWDCSGCEIVHVPEITEILIRLEDYGMKKKHITEILELIHVYGHLQNHIGIQLGAGVKNELMHSDRKKAEDIYEKIEKKLSDKHAV